MTKPLNTNKNSGSETSSNLIIWQGPNLPCIDLCKGDNITEVIYKLALKLCNIFDTLNIEKYDLTCLELDGCLPKTFTDLINTLIILICELKNEGGPQGDPGTPGNYVQIFFETVGANCANGGIRVELHDGVTTALISTEYICNGSNGTNGAQGIQGPPGISVVGPAGQDGYSGRGVAVFVQVLEPTPTDFNTLYGSVEGFGVNYITGNNMIKPGDIWIEPC